MRNISDSATDRIIFGKVMESPLEKVQCGGCGEMVCRKDFVQEMQMCVWCYGAWVDDRYADQRPEVNDYRYIR